MLTITNADLTAFNRLSSTIAQVIKLMQAELDVAVYTGRGTVEIRYGAALASVVGLSTTYSDLDPLDPGLLRELVNDLHLSTIEPQWTSSHGGALLLRAIFEEEGTEIRGTLDFDLKHMEMRLYFVPKLNAAGEVSWTIETEVELDGPALLDTVKRQIEASILESGLTATISDSLAPVTDMLGMVLGLDPTVEDKSSFGSFEITDDEATFNDPPPGTRVDVVFDAVTVLDDSDWPGQGELSFRPTVQGVSQTFSEEYSAASGTRVPLVGAHWRVPVVVPMGESLVFSLTMRDRENIGADEIRGTATLTLTAVDLQARLPGPAAFAIDSDRGDFTLHARVLAPGRGAAPSAQQREIAITLASVQQLRDRDTFGKGEVAYQLVVNNIPSRVSTPHKTAGREDERFPPHDDAGQLLAVTVHPALDESVSVSVEGWDVDPSQRDSMGRATQTFGPGTLFDDSDIHLRSSGGDFVAVIRMKDLTPSADGDDTENGSGATRPDDAGSGSGSGTTIVERLVIFDSVTLRKDGDTVGAGDIVVEGSLSPVELDQDGADSDKAPPKYQFGGGDPLKMGGKGTLPLVGENFRQSIKLRETQALEVTAKVIDVDGDRDEGQGNDDLMARLTARFDKDSAFGLGTQHLENDDVDVKLRIVDPGNTGEVTATVRFEQYIVLRDHTALAPGKFWARAFVNGFPLDDGEKINTTGGDDDTSDHAGRGDIVLLDAADWQRVTHINPGGVITVEFELFEARDNDHKSLGRVVANFREPFTEMLHTLIPDSGDYELAVRVMPPAEARANQLRVTFTDVQVLDDGDIWSEGELVFLGQANVARTPQGAVTRAKRGEWVTLTGAGWELVCGVDIGDRLDITFTQFDEDRETLQSLGVAIASFNWSNKWGLGEHLITAGGNAFRVRVRIEPATATSIPDLPDVVQRAVMFGAVQVSDDGDALDNGEITFSASINGSEAYVSPQYKVSSGDSLFLRGFDEGTRVWLAPDDRLDVALRADEQDSGRTQSLGTATVSFAGPDWPVLEVHRATASSGAFNVDMQLIDPSQPSYRVKFQKVRILGDREAIGRGELSFEGVVNGVATGESERMKAGRDGQSSRDDLKSLIFLGGPRWSRPTWLLTDDDGRLLPIRFTGWEHDAFGRQALGTVEASIDVLGTGWTEPFTGDAMADGVAFPDRYHIQLAGNFVRHFTFRADSGKYEVTLLVELPIPPALLEL